ncbi:uncharacterized protein [Typha latifolia]|uniref:uncharacterized protein n=1 Tax=Typha latifolia TaxID=4733 RepID=UPI003C2CE1F5
MSCVRTNIYRPSVQIVVKGSNGRLRRTSSLSQSSSLHAPYFYASARNKLQQHVVYPKLIYDASYHKRCAPICAVTGNGCSKSENEPFSWESLNKAMGELKQKRSIEDLFWEQMQERGFGGYGGNRNHRRGGDGSGPEDAGFAGMLDELLQVVLATIGFIFLYVCIIRGEELTLLARDYIRYLLGAKCSSRLKRAMYRWQEFYESMTRKISGSKQLLH